MINRNIFHDCFTLAAAAAASLTTAAVSEPSLAVLASSTSRAGCRASIWTLDVSRVSCYYTCIVMYVHVYHVTRVVCSVTMVLSPGLAPPYSITASRPPRSARTQPAASTVSSPSAPAAEVSRME